MLLVAGAVVCVLALAGKYVRFSDYRDRLSRHNVEWQGLSLQLDSGFVFDVQEGKLLDSPAYTRHRLEFDVARGGRSGVKERLQAAPAVVRT
jgi:hypothetical protein